jgi:hypothetical protein
VIKLFYYNQTMTTASFFVPYNRVMGLCHIFCIGYRCLMGSMLSCLGHYSTQVGLGAGTLDMSSWTSVLSLISAEHTVMQTQSMHKHCFSVRVFLLAMVQCEDGIMKGKRIWEMVLHLSLPSHRPRLDSMSTQNHCARPQAIFLWLTPQMGIYIGTPAFFIIINTLII